MSARGALWLAVGLTFAAGLAVYPLAALSLAALGGALYAVRS